MAKSKKKAVVPGNDGETGARDGVGKDGAIPGPAENVFILKPPPVKDGIEYEKVLNPEQVEAVFHTRGPAIVIAGAGSGKTRVITYKVARMLEYGIPAYSIMLVTFTKKAAEEMITRVEKLSGVGKGSLVAGTFHSIAARFLRRHAESLGFHPNFSILDEADSDQVMKRVLGRFVEGKGDEEKRLYPKPSELKDMYSRSMNLHMPLKDVLENFFPEYASLEQSIARMLQDYFEMKQRGNLMDFDDLLVYFLRLLRTDGVKEKVFNQVRHLLVDEYQDVNQIQADIVIELGQRADSVMVVGDDAQAIYSFRGASIQHMLDFPEVFDQRAKEYFLTTNYRSNPPILALANASIKHNKVQFKKTLKPTRDGGQLPEVVPCSDNNEEANFICQSIKQWRDQGTPLHEQAVLFRAAHLSLVLEKSLLSYKIPYVKRAGLRFYETAHIKDLLSFCFIVVNPRNEIPWSRVLGLLPGMGSKSIEQAIDTIQKSSNPLEAFVTENLREKLKGKRIQATAFDEMERIQKLFREIATDKGTGAMLPEERLGKPDAFLSRVMKVYEPLLRVKHSKDADERLLDLKEFLNIAAAYPSIHAMVDEIAISETFAGERTKDPDKQERPLVLSTVHQAKGLEWDVVYVMGVTENTFPSARSAQEPAGLEEERRVFYVAVTRARKHLCFSYPVSQWTFTDRKIAQRSSFLEEIERSNVFKVTRVGYQATSFDDLVSRKRGW